MHLNGIFSDKPKNQQNRRVRSDKKKDIKFPVTPDMQKALRWLYKRMKQTTPEITQTAFNSQLLENAIKQPFAIHREVYKEIDKTNFMHVKVKKDVYKIIEQRALDSGASDRETVYWCISESLSRGARL